MIVVFLRSFYAVLRCFLFSFLCGIPILLPQRSASGIPGDYVFFAGGAGASKEILGSL